MRRLAPEGCARVVEQGEIPEASTGTKNAGRRRAQGHSTLSTGAHARETALASLSFTVVCDNVCSTAALLIPTDKKEEAVVRKV